MAADSCSRPTAATPRARSTATRSRSAGPTTCRITSRQAAQPTSGSDRAGRWPARSLPLVGCAACRDVIRHVVGPADLDLVAVDLARGVAAVGREHESAAIHAEHADRHLGLALRPIGYAGE